MGPSRWYPPPLPLAALRDVDLVLISHDHYDHLDQPTIERMVDWSVPFVVPLGVGAHLEYWGIDPDRITELDWWQQHEHGDLRIETTVQVKSIVVTAILGRRKLCIGCNRGNLGSFDQVDQGIIGVTREGAHQRKYLIAAN